MRGIVPNVGQWPAYVHWAWRTGSILVTGTATDIHVHEFVREKGRWDHLLSLSMHRPVGSFEFQTQREREGWQQFLDGSGLVRRSRAFEHLEAASSDGSRRIRGGLRTDGLSLTIESDAPIALSASGRGDSDTPDIVTREVGAWQVAVHFPRGSRESARITIATEALNSRPPPFSDGQAIVSQHGLAWSTFLGGTDEDDIRDVLLRPDGRVVVVGETQSPDYPIGIDALDTSFSRSLEGFVSEVAHDGGQVIFSTYLGGVQGDAVMAARLRSDGCIVVVGFTASSDFPTTPDAFLTRLQGIDSFVTILSPAADSIVASTFLGGGTPLPGGLSLTTWVQDLVVAPNGDVVVTGRTTAVDFPTTPGSLEPEFPGGGLLQPVFLTRFAADLASLVYSTYIVGPAGHNAYGIALSETEEITLVGPTVGGAHVTRISADGSRMIYSQLLSGAGTVRLFSVADIGAGEVVVAGNTTAADLPVAPDAFQTGFLIDPPGFSDAFVLHLAADGSTALWGSYLGGLRDEYHPIGLHVDASGAITLVGRTDTSTTFPVTPGAFQTIKGGAPATTADFFVTRFHPDGHTLNYSTYVGGPGPDAWTSGSGWRMPMAVAPDGSVIVGGGAVDGFPITPGAAFETYIGGGDGVVFRLTMLPSGVTRVGAPSPDPVNGPHLSAHHAPFLDSTDFALLVSGAPSQGAGFVAVSASGLDVPMTVAGIQLWLEPRGLVLQPWLSDERGFADLRLFIPSDPELLGLSFSAQSFWPVPAGWIASDSLTIEITTP